MPCPGLLQLPLGHLGVGWHDSEVVSRPARYLATESPARWSASEPMSCHSGLPTCLAGAETGMLNGKLRTADLWPESRQDTCPPYHGSTEEGVMLASQPSPAVSEAGTAGDTSCRFQWPSPQAKPRLCGQRPGSRGGGAHGCNAPPTPLCLRVDTADPEPATLPNANFAERRLEGLWVPTPHWARGKASTSRHPHTSMAGIGKWGTWP